MQYWVDSIDIENAKICNLYIFLLKKADVANILQSEVKKIMLFI